jgi:hypothetical protein
LKILQDVISHHSADVLLGRDVGAPPLPAASTVRLNLLDLVSSLQLLHKVGEDAAIAAPSQQQTAPATAPKATTVGASADRVTAASSAVTSLDWVGTPSGRAVNPANGVGAGSAGRSADTKSRGASGLQTAEAEERAAVEERSAALAAAAKPDAVAREVGAAAEAFNHAASALWPDFYYELSAVHSSHLEVPFRLPIVAAAAAVTPSSAELAAAAAASPILPAAAAPAACAAPAPVLAAVPAAAAVAATMAPLPAALVAAANTANTTSFLASTAAAEAHPATKPPQACLAAATATDTIPQEGTSAACSGDHHSAPASLCQAGFKQVAQGLEGLLHGVPFLRQLLPPPGYSRTAEAAEDGVGRSSVRYTLEPSIHRGGSTFIISPQALLVPQTAYAARRWEVDAYEDF